MEENQTYQFSLWLSHYNGVNNQIDKHRNKIPQGDNVDVTFGLFIRGSSWHPNNDTKNVILDLMDEFKCTHIALCNLNEVDPGLKEILTKAFKTWNSLELRDKFSGAELCLRRNCSDASFKSIVELIIANGGIQKLQIYNFDLSNESWELFNSHKLGTGREGSTIEFYPTKFSIEFDHPFNRPRIADEVFAQVLENLSGFKTLKINIDDGESSFPKAFRNLGQNLSRPDCEVSKLFLENCTCAGQMLETLTTNSSVKELFTYLLRGDDLYDLLSDDAADDAPDDSEDDAITSIMKQIHKFTRLTDLQIGRLEESQSLDFLRPLLDNSSLELMANPSLETLTLSYCGAETKIKPSKVENDLLLQVAQRYPALRSFGQNIALTPELNYTLCMNSKWRQYMTQEPELPLSFWRFVLEDVEKDPYTNEKQQRGVEPNEEYKAAIVASIRYELVKHIVPRNISNFIRLQKRKGETKRLTKRARKH